MEIRHTRRTLSVFLIFDFGRRHFWKIRPLDKTKKGRGLRPGLVLQ